MIEFTCSSQYFVAHNISYLSTQEMRNNFPYFSSRLYILSYVNNLALVARIIPMLSRLKGLTGKNEAPLKIRENDSSSRIYRKNQLGSASELIVVVTTLCATTFTAGWNTRRWHGGVCVRACVRARNDEQTLHKPRRGTLERGSYTSNWFWETFQTKAAGFLLLPPTAKILAGELRWGTLDFGTEKIITSATSCSRCLDLLHAAC